MPIQKKDIPDYEPLVDINILPIEEQRDIEREFDYATDKSKPLWSRVKAFFRGENKAGRKVGAILDIATIFLPGPIRTGRKAAQIIINSKQEPEMKNAFKRAITNDGGTFLKVRNEDGEIDPSAIGAAVIRVVIIAGIFYGLHLLGLTEHAGEIIELITG